MQDNIDYSKPLVDDDINSASNIDYSKPLVDDDINSDSNINNVNNINTVKGSSPFEFPHLTPAAKNFFKAFYNTNVNALNFPIEQLNKLVGSDKFTKIPTAKTTGGLSKILGEMGGYLIPDALVLKGLRNLGNVGKVAETFENMPNLLRNILKHATAQGITGGLVAPEGERERAAKISAAVGGGLAPISSAISRIKRVGLPTAYKKLINLYSKSKPFNVDENSTENMLRDIVQNYTNVLNDANKNYTNIFENAKGNLKPEQLENYNEVLEKSPDYGKKYLLSHDTLAGFPTEDNKRTISLKKLHHYRSDIGELINKKTQRNDYEGMDVLKRAKNALSKDLKEGLKDVNQLDNYKAAQKAFKEKVLPFRTKARNTRLSPVENLYHASNVLNIGGNRALNPYQLLRPGEGNNADILAKPFIETPGKTNLDRLKLLTKYLNGDRNKAVEYTKNYLFKNTYNPDTDLINTKKFINIYDKLSNVQKNALFTKEQTNILNALRRAKEQGGRSSSKNILLKSLLLGGAGLAFGHSPELGAAAGFSVLPFLKYITPKISESLLPDNEQELVKYIESSTKKNKNSSLSPLLTSLLSTQTRGDQ